MEPQVPSFLVIGAMKAGTTSLHRYLDTHPEVSMSAPKELDFFVPEKNWSRGWDWYRSHFKMAGRAALFGESSTNYTKYPRFGGTAERIHQHLPDIKLVYLLRDPVERCVSHVLHRWGAHGKPGVLARDVLDPHVVACSSYALQIEQYLQHFPASQMLTVFSEDLLHDQGATMKRVFNFLGATPMEVPGLDVRHGATADDDLVTSAVGPVLPDATGLDHDTRRRLCGHLLPDLERLQAVLVDAFADRRGALQVESWLERLAS